MKRRIAVLLVVLFTLVAVAAEAATPAAPPDTSKRTKPARLKSVTLLIGSRVFADFRDLETATLNKEFPVGASDYTARVVQYIPDFGIDQKMRVVSRSNEPRNPAVRVIVKESGVTQDTSWAFANFPPHYSRRSLLSFRLVRIEFVDAPAIHVEVDTTGIDPSKLPKKAK
jgi:hypothetical protein